MKYRINVISVSELGQRQNQEDSIFPVAGESTANDRLFILCDGMGGHECGEIASSTVCEAMKNYVYQNCAVEGEFGQEDFEGALSVAYDALDRKDNGSEKKMGTTMTFLKLHSGGCLLAHIGDSRIYHIRPSEIGAERLLYVSRDHSLINNLVEMGEMTLEEALNSGQKNVITRAMQPMLEPRPGADVRNVVDIQPGDYFYMCTDGMLEQMDDMELADILSMDDNTDEDKMEMILSLTAGNRDNHSAHLIRIVDVENEDVVEFVPVEIADDSEMLNLEDSEDEQEPDNLADPIVAEPENKHRNKMTLMLALLLILLLGAAGYYVYDSIFDEKNIPPEQRGIVDEEEDMTQQKEETQRNNVKVPQKPQKPKNTSTNPVSPKAEKERSADDAEGVPSVVETSQKQISFNANSGEIRFGDVIVYKLIKIGNTYKIGQTEVTRRFWDAVMSGQGTSSDLPKTDVSYRDCEKFISKLNELTDLDYFRLPSKDEWVTAAKGDFDYEYSGSDDFTKVAVTGKLSKVKTLESNGYGLYDMSGNVREWTSTKKGPRYFVKGGYYGSVDSEEYKCDNDAVTMGPDEKNDYTGFRIVWKQK